MELERVWVCAACCAAVTTQGHSSASALGP